LTLPEVGLLGWEVWQEKAGLIIDNIIVTDDENEADSFLKKTFNNDLRAREQAMLDAAEQVAEELRQAERERIEALIKEQNVGTLFDYFGCSFY